MHLGKLVWRRPGQKDGESRRACRRTVLGGRGNGVSERAKIREVGFRDGQRLGSRERGAVTRHDMCRRVVPQQLDQACERRPVIGRRRSEREFDGGEVVADGEQIELPDAVRGAVVGVAAKCSRLDDEGPI